jgi:hypothetical protein
MIMAAPFFAVSTSSPGTPNTFRVDIRSAFA